MAEEQSRRDVIESAMEAAMNDALEKVEEAPIEVAPVDDIAEEVQAERNEKGQYASKEAEVEETPLSVSQDETPEEVEEDIPEPSTWKKEYRGLFNKVKGGENLSKEEGKNLLNYINQRDTEYKRGVSTYKAEAERAKSLEEAINPFIPELQAQNISPAAWINNLGRAHMVLSKAPYEQKVAMFNQLAADYGIQLNNSSQMADMPPDVINQQLMQTIQSLQSEVQSVKGWKQQEEDSKLMSEIEKFSSNKDLYPFFEEVRADMSRLLGAGLANNLKEAYELAERTNNDVWQRKQENLLADARDKAIKAQQVQKAKAASVSVKSVTPSGKINAPATKDRRSTLSELVGEALNNRI